MQVANFLEGFGFAYGWAVYGLFYTFFAVTGIIVYPLTKVIIGTMLDFAGSTKYAGDAHLKAAFVKIGVILIVFLSAILPMASVDVTQATVKPPCDTDYVEKVPMNYFKNNKIYVPLIPYIASKVGQGLNNTIYNNTPCVMSLREMTVKLNAEIDLADTSDEGGLVIDIDRFQKECYNEAIHLAKKIEENKYGTKAQKTLLDKMGEDDAYKILSAWPGSTDYKTVTISSMISPEIVELFYEGKIVDGVTDENEINNLKDVLPIRSKSGVNGVAAYTGEDSKQQNVGDNVPVSCGDWWNEKLKPNLTKAGQLAFGLQALGNEKLKGKSTICIVKDKNKIYDPDWIKNNETKIGGCAQFALEADSRIDPNDVNWKAKLHQKYLELALSSPQAQSALSTGDTVALGSIAAASTLGSVLGVFGFDIGINAGDLVGFYTGLYLVKIFMKFLQPLVLMSLFMFWGFYMIAGELSGKTLIKGVVFIFLITIIPGLWSIADSLDDYMFTAMYGSADDRQLTGSLVTAVNKNPAEIPIMMLLFDMVMTLFYIIFPGILLWFVSQADIGNPMQLGNEINNNSRTVQGAATPKTSMKGLGKTPKTKP